MSYDLNTNLSIMSNCDAISPDLIKMIQVIIQEEMRAVFKDDLADNVDKIETKKELPIESETVTEDPTESIDNDEIEFLFLDTKGMTQLEKIKLADILDIKMNAPNTSIKKAMTEDDLVDKVDIAETEKEVDVCILDLTEEVGFIAPESVLDLVFTKKNDAEKDVTDTKDIDSDDPLKTEK